VTSQVREKPQEAENKQKHKKGKKYASENSTNDLEISLCQA
jgi:hypothetical protein